MSEKYTRGDVPIEAEDLGIYLEAELDKMGAILNALVDGEIEESNVAPSKPRTGMIRLADGTNWDPGSGQGVYAYYGGAWNKL